MPASTPRPLPSSAKKRIFLQVQLPGVPWYIYHDRFDAYLAHEQKPNLSVAVFDLSINPENQHLLLGAARIPLLSLPSVGATATATEWTKLDGLRGWHHSVGPIKDFVYVVGERHPSTNYRSVRVDGQYKLEEAGAGIEAGYLVTVRLRSLIGENESDGNTEEGRNTVPPGRGEFRITLKKTGDGDGDKAGWEIVGTEGIELQEGETVVNW